MAEIQGISGSSVRAPRPAAERPAASAVDGSGGRARVGADDVQPRRAGIADEQGPQVIRFEGMDLDPNAPRGTYLDILV